MASKWVVFLGSPGCGKGTQAADLVEKDGFRAIVVGDILRNSHEKPVQEYGKTVGELIDAGTLLPDKVVGMLVRDELKKVQNVASSNVIFDGYPRTIGQAEILNELAREFEKEIDVVLNFVIDDEIIKSRILGRFKCTGCGRIYNDFFAKPTVDGECDSCGGTAFKRRADDNEESLKRRLAEYSEKTNPLVEYYKDAGLLRDIDAGEVATDVRKAVLSAISR
jgi:adenylate kinase